MDHARHRTLVDTVVNPTDPCTRRPSRVDPDGHVLTSTDVGDRWQDVATLPEQAMVADGTRIAVLAGDTVDESVDGGGASTERFMDIRGYSSKGGIT